MLCYIELQDWESAALAGNIFLKKFPNHPRQRDCLTNILYCYEQLNDYEKALEVVQQILDVIPLNSPLRAELHYKKYQFYTKTNQKDLALDELIRAKKTKPLDNKWRLTALSALAYHNELNGQWLEALGIYKEIIDSTNDPRWKEAASQRVKEIENAME